MCPTFCENHRKGIFAGVSGSTLRKRCITTNCFCHSSSAPRSAAFFHQALQSYDALLDELHHWVMSVVNTTTCTDEAAKWLAQNGDRTETQAPVPRPCRNRLTGRTEHLSQNGYGDSLQTESAKVTVHAKRALVHRLSRRHSLCASSRQASRNAPSTQVGEQDTRFLSCSIAWSSCTRSLAEKSAQRRRIVTRTATMVVVRSRAVLGGHQFVQQEPCSTGVAMGIRRSSSSILLRFLCWPPVR